MNDNIFVTMSINDKVKLTAQSLNSSLKKQLLHKLQSKFEGKCSHHGYIRKNSIKLDDNKYSPGSLQEFSLNGDIMFMVSFQADVCNPAIGSIVQAKVINVNSFGILAENEILEIIIAKQIQNTNINYDNIKTGSEISVEILGKKQQLNDQKISIVGKIVEGSGPKLVFDEMEREYDDNDEDNIDDAEYSSEEDESKTEEDGKSIQGGDDDSSTDDDECDEDLDDGAMDDGDSDIGSEQLGSDEE